MDLESILNLIAKYYNQYIPPYLAADYEGAVFQRFGIPHLTVLGTTALLTLLIILTRHKLKNEDKAALRELMAQILIINEIISYLWLYFYQGLEPMQITSEFSLTIIPINLISLLAWISAFMLLKKSGKLYEIVYFIGLIPALYALVMPSASPYGFPHYRVFYALITPAIIFLSAIYMTVAEEEVEIKLMSVLRALITANIIMAIVYGINAYLGTNFLNLLTKPKTSLLPLPDAPLHILYYEGIGIAISLILYIPFLIQDRLRRRNLRADTQRIDNFIP